MNRQSLRTATMSARWLIREAWTGIRRHLALTAALSVTVAVALTLLGSAMFVSRQVDLLKGHWYDKVEMSVFLCAPGADEERCTTPVTKDQREKVRTALTSSPLVERVYYESPEQAWKHFQEQFGDSAIGREATSEAMPASFRVKLVDPTRSTEVADLVAPIRGVESVADQRAVLSRFFSVMGSVQAIATIVAITQAVIALILVTVTVRSTALARRRQMRVMRLVGASPSMVAAPFVVEAVVAGLAGAALASSVLAIAKHVLIDGKLAAGAYLNLISWSDYGAVVATLFAAAILMPAAAAALAVPRRSH